MKDFVPYDICRAISLTTLISVCNKMTSSRMGYAKSQTKHWEKSCFYPSCVIAAQATCMPLKCRLTSQNAVAGGVANYCKRVYIKVKLN
jgi:hypothetical protein